jgi:hypothetical protein
MSLAREILADNQRYLQHHGNGVPNAQPETSGASNAQSDASTADGDSSNSQSDSSNSRSDSSNSQGDGVSGAIPDSEKKTPANGFSL